MFVHGLLRPGSEALVHHFASLEVFRVTMNVIFVLLLALGDRSTVTEHVCRDVTTHVQVRAGVVRSTSCTRRG